MLQIELYLRFGFIAILIQKEAIIINFCAFTVVFLDDNLDQY